MRCPLLAVLVLAACQALGQASPFTPNPADTLSLASPRPRALCDEEPSIERWVGCFVPLPEPPVGWGELSAYLTGRITYPATALRDSVEGKVIIAFIVDSMGAVGGPPCVLKGVRPDLDSAALSVIRFMPPWKPATTDRGRKVASRMVLPVSFGLHPVLDSRNRRARKR